MRRSNCGGGENRRPAGFDVPTTKVAKGKKMPVFLPVFQKTGKSMANDCHKAKYGKYLPYNGDAVCIPRIPMYTLPHKHLANGSHLPVF